MNADEYLMACSEVAAKYLIANGFGAGSPFYAALAAQVDESGCKSGMDKSNAEALLRSGAWEGAPPLRADQSGAQNGASWWTVLHAFDQTGGHCDCEILLNTIEAVSEHAAF